MPDLNYKKITQKYTPSITYLYNVIHLTRSSEKSCLSSLSSVILYFKLPLLIQ